MPTYEYECRSCGAGFDVFQSMSDPPLTVCPTCGKDVRRKINGGTGIIFKGSGFYINDSRKAESQSESSRSGGSHGAPKSESKTPSAPAAPVSDSSSSSSEAPKKDPA
jgi:putative FmdB family regulatory protein